MANIQAYPTGTPKVDDLLLGTSVPLPNTDAKPTTNNFKVSDISSLANIGYKVYTAALTQAGTAAPVAAVLQNTTGGVFTWSRVDTGKYRVTVSGITLPANKVVIFENATNDLNLGGKITSTTVIDVEQFSSGGGGYSDVMLPGTSIEIRIYS
tara:strand:+ start:139 stop:597 length:459 start_codon:yes stop_codon:yes gene_type:complete